MLRLNPTSVVRRGMVQCCWRRHGCRASNFVEETNRCFGQATPISVATAGWQYRRRPRLTVRVDRWFQMRGWVGPRAIHNYLYVSEQMLDTWVHSSVVRALTADQQVPGSNPGVPYEGFVP